MAAWPNRFRPRTPVQLAFIGALSNRRRRWCEPEEICLRLFVALLVASISAASAGPAAAQSCYRLQAELEYLQREGGGRAGGARYERAYREQARVLRRTEARARDAGCFGGGFFLFRREPARACRTLVPKLNDMHDNLVRLDRLRRGSGGGNPRRARAIRALMAEMGCGRPGVRQARVPQGRERGLDGGMTGGTYRTLCVRTCDGYYFPISYSTKRGRFAADAETCSAMCPGAEARLFYHPNPGGGPEDMVAVTGEAYASLDTAFRFRTSYDPACSCKPAGAMSVAAADPRARPALQAKSDPLPGPPRPEPGEDPETLANRDGRFTPRYFAEDDAVVAGGPALQGGNAVRTVGPMFGTSPEQAGVLQTPVPN